MKAFKQIDLSNEKRIVFSYVCTLCLLCFFVMLNPIFGQEKDEADPNRPEIKIDVKKGYDEHGNVIGYDSTYSWYWYGNDFGFFDQDSVFSRFKQGLPSYFWYWKDLDSSMHSLFDEEWLDHFLFVPPNMPGFFHFEKPLDDSLGISFHKFQDMDKFLDDEFDMDQFFPNEEYLEKFYKKQNEYMERFLEYQREHRKLIEKYFGEPQQGDDKDIKIDRNKTTPEKDNKKSNKSGTI